MSLLEFFLIVQGSGRAWYIRQYRQSMDGQDDPVAKLRNKLFRSALEMIRN